MKTSSISLLYLLLQGSKGHACIFKHVNISAKGISKSRIAHSKDRLNFCIDNY